MPDDQLQVNAKPANLTISPPGSNRHKALAVIITKAHACAGSPALELAVLAQHAAWWDEALLGIPTDRLDEVYRYAIAHHTSPFPLGTGAMVAAWDAIRTAPTFRMIPPPTPAEREQAETERKANVAAFEARMRELA